MKRKSFKVLAFTAMFCALASGAMAYTQPQAGTFGYEVFEFMESAIGGAIGVCCALAMLGYCIYFILRSNLFGAIPCAVAALMLIKLPDIVYSIGVTLPI
jgi:hypothetical protein